MGLLPLLMLSVAMVLVYKTMGMNYKLISMHTVNFRLLVPSIVVKQKFKLTNQIQDIPKRHRV